MTGKVIEFLGWPGLASMGLGLLALVLRSFLERLPRRVSWRAPALAAAIGAVVCAYFAVRDIGQIQIDRSAERTAAAEEKQRLRAEARRVLKERAAKIRFAEDRPDDHLDVAGIRKVDAPVISAATMEIKEGPGQRGRVLPEPQVRSAQRLGQLNLAASWLVLVLVLLALAGDYLRAFNQDIALTAPLPLAGRVLDAIFPKGDPLQTLSAGPDALRGALERLARRGESFIYFGPACPLKQPQLPRLVFGRWRAWALPVESIGAERLPVADLLFQAAWEGRRALVVDDVAQPAVWLDALMIFLRTHCRARARAPRTVNVIWDGEPEVLEQRRAELAVLCQEANFRLIVTVQSWSTTPPLPPLAKGGSTTAPPLTKGGAQPPPP
jgi:hypothetical protein